MARYVTCQYCKQRFDRDKHPFVQVSSRRYAHEQCALTEQEKQSQIEKDKNELEQYIMKLFNIAYIDARVKKQIKQYIEEYNYTYSGIKKSLVYFFEIKGNSVEKANGGIGIVPYIYKKAHDYYLALWQAQQKNNDKDISKFIPEVIEINIPRPQRKIKTKKLFTFLDEEGE